MSDTLTIVGVCNEITERNGWQSFAILAPGKQYPVKLSTKREDLIAQARSVGGNVATWTYTEKESERINPHNNQPYVDRWLEGVEAGATAEAQAASDTPESTASSSPQTSTHQALPAGDRERSIIRQTCIKAACELYAGKGWTDYENGDESDAPLAVMRAADRFERWIVRDLSEPPF